MSAVVALLSTVALGAPSGTTPAEDNSLQVNTTSGLVNGIVNASYPDVRQL